MNRWNCETYCDGGTMNEAPDGEFVEYRDTLDYAAALIASGADPASVVLSQRQREAVGQLARSIVRIECWSCGQVYDPNRRTMCPRCASPATRLVTP